MNESPEPIQPDDDASDPLLTALRQRLGGYGEAPPAGAWAGIRQRLPVAARPWWRRPSRLLPLLALLGLVATGLLTRRAARPKGGLATSGLARPHSATGATAQPATSDLITDSQRIKVNTNSSTGANSLPPVAGLKPVRPASRVNSQAGNNTAPRRGTAPWLPAPTTRSQPARRRPLVAKATTKRGALPPVISRTTLPSTGAGRKLRRTPGHRLADAFADNRATPSRFRRTALPAEAASAGQSRAVGPVASRQQSGRQRRSASRALVASRRAAHRTGLPGFTAGAVGPSASSLPTSRATTLAKAGVLAAGRYSETAITGRSTAFELGQLVDSLQDIVSKLTPAMLAGLPTPLAARPDSLRPPYPPVRRWALLALAGPTLSYRTIGPAPATTTGYPDFAHLERPALGLGAQVQIRRVLSGRWALAVGVGYQEYATRLALQLGDSSTGHIQQRDTYRLLTLPLQLSYALGAPRGRLARALLLGVEAGWYRGGRSTEGGDCGCQQQAYTSTANPYYSWSLALSLGLDLRYRIGGPASRWQWVVQPIGRYVLTPFVKPTAAGFSPRQPFSLGVLTGFSWDIR